MVFRVVVHMVDITVMMLLELTEIGQVMDEVEVDLIKVQMSADLGLLVGQFLEILPDVTIVKNQAIY